MLVIFSLRSRGVGSDSPVGYEAVSLYHKLYPCTTSDYMYHALRVYPHTKNKKTKKLRELQIFCCVFSTLAILATFLAVFAMACRSYSARESAELINIGPGSAIEPWEDEIITASSLNLGEIVSEAVNEPVSNDDDEKLFSGRWACWIRFLA